MDFHFEYPSLIDEEVVIMQRELMDLQPRCQIEMEVPSDGLTRGEVSIEV